MKSAETENKKHFFKDQLPSGTPKIIFWETSFAVAAILEPKGSSAYNAIVGFLGRLQKENCYIAFSTHLFYEFFWACLKNEARKQYGDKKVARKKIENNFQEVSLKCLSEVEKNFNSLVDLLSKFPDRVIKINFEDPGIIRKTMELAHQYRLDMGDLIHIGTMLYGNKKDMVSFDQHFRIPIINVWCRYQRS